MSVSVETQTNFSDTRFSDLEMRVYSLERSHAINSSSLRKTAIVVGTYFGAVALIYTTLSVSETLESRFSEKTLGAFFGAVIPTFGFLASIWTPSKTCASKLFEV